MTKRKLIPISRIDASILVLRRQKVILDANLAKLYGVSTKRFNEQVKRNRERFPPDFMFQLSREEYESLRSQVATLETGRGKHRKYLPRAFTEHGAIMAASVLNSPKAIEMSILVVRAFVRLRKLLVTHRALGSKLNELERKYASHDQQITVLFDAIRDLMTLPEKARRRIGFQEN